MNLDNGDQLVIRPTKRDRKKITSFAKMQETQKLSHRKTTVTEEMFLPPAQTPVQETRSMQINICYGENSFQVTINDEKPERINEISMEISELLMIPDQMQFVNAIDESQLHPELLESICLMRSIINLEVSAEQFQPQSEGENPMNEEVPVPTPAPVAAPCVPTPPPVAAEATQTAAITLQEVLVEFVDRAKDMKTVNQVKLVEAGYCEKYPEFSADIELESKKLLSYMVQKGYVKADADESISGWKAAAIGVGFVGAVIAGVFAWRSMK